MSQTAGDDSIVGRGNREGARLFRQWFDGLGPQPRRTAAAPMCS